MSDPQRFPSAARPIVTTAMVAALLPVFSYLIDDGRRIDVEVEVGHPYFADRAAETCVQPRSTPRSPTATS